MSVIASQYSLLLSHVRCYFYHVLVWCSDHPEFVIFIFELSSVSLFCVICVSIFIRNSVMEQEMRS